ncbi:DUF2169 domain-containing protein [Stieleria sp.]|uniref:DUF2169 family type VI secretion system accessory protein n=1 Tax=Stieleria sp. TaxID=2795976 RepID=UPI00356765C5
MLQVHNQTDYETALSVLFDKDGIEAAFLVIKATLLIDQPDQPAETQLPIFYVDEHWGDPESTSVKYPADMTLSKPATDVVLNGTAHAPGSNPTTQVDVQLAVGDTSKTVRVIGDRVWQKGLVGITPSKPAEFVSMPLVYELAFGGADVHPDGREDWAMENPVGRGFLASDKSSNVDGAPLPNLETPGQELKRWSDRPTPAAFGAIAAHWNPRSTLAGTFDEDWEKSRSPFLPTDFNPSFLNAAHPDLICDTYLQGGEAVSIRGVHPEQWIQFALPTKQFRIRYQLAGQESEAEPRLETLLIDTDKREYVMVWRAAVPCPKQSTKLNWIAVDEVSSTNRRA